MDPYPDRRSRITSYNVCYTKLLRAVDGDPTEAALIVAARKAGLDEASVAVVCPRSYNFV